MKLATLCYVRQGEKTLMLHRVKKANDMHEGKWNGLGGKVEDGETPEECAIREIKEESGLDIKNPQLKGLLTFPKFKNDETWYVYLFLCTEVSGELIESDEGNLAWIDNEKLLELNLWAGDQIFIPWLELDGIRSGKFSYVDGELIDYTVIEHCK